MKKFISMMAMAMVMLWSCQEKDGPEVAAPGKVELAGSVTDGQIAVGPDGGEFQVNVTSSEDWRVSGISDWVTVSAESGKSGQPLTFTVMPNDDTKSRTATFKVFSADAVQAVTLVQSPMYKMSLVSEDTVQVSSDANQVAVRLVSNVEEVSVDFGGAENWVKLNNVSDALGKKIVLFDVSRSQEFKGRSAVLTLSGEGVTEPISVFVSQAQRDTAFVEGEQSIIKGLEALSLNLVLKSNVDVTYSLPSWLRKTEGSVTEKDDTGLKTQEITLTADASSGSRGTTISFRSGSKTVGSLFVKQQNPNPVFAEIPDENLRYLLESKGWIIPDDGIKCELLGDAINATSLVIGSADPNSYSSDPITSIEGLESFPNLESLTVGCVNVEKIDVSNYPKLNELNLANLNRLSEINTGNRPITHIKNAPGTYSYIQIQNIVIKGENIVDIDYSVINNYYVDYESALESIDVTECPKLESINVMRYNSWGESSLRYLYMTAAQAESVSVTKLDKVEIVVK